MSSPGVEVSPDTEVPVLAATLPAEVLGTVHSVIIGSASLPAGATPMARASGMLKELVEGLSACAVERGADCVMAFGYSVHYVEDQVIVHAHGTPVTYPPPARRWWQRR